MNPIQHILMFVVRLYRWTLSPLKIALFGPTGRCRFTPSCSQYALDAIRMHGAVRGSWLAIRRICRCHPWGDCGHDPVPECEFETASSKLNASTGVDSQMQSRCCTIGAISLPQR